MTAQVTWLQLSFGLPGQGVTVAVTGVSATGGVGTVSSALTLVEPAGVGAQGTIGSAVAEGKTGTDGTFNDLLRDVIIALPNDAAAEILTEWGDFESQTTGVWMASGAWNFLGGTTGAPTIGIEISNDASTVLDTIASGDSAEARYARLRISVPAGTVIKTRPAWQVRRAVTPVFERGTVTVVTGGRATVSLQNKYSSYISITLTPASSQVAVAVYDAVTLHPTNTNTFDVVLFDGNNAQGAGEVSWVFNGIRS